MIEFEKGLVSVVTPVYNGENYIHKLLQSVLAQTYDRIQMIVADDGSSDRTMEVVESYRRQFLDRGYTLDIISGAHSCAAGAMCNGLPKVKGEFLIWPDGDDELLPESVELRVRFLEDNPDAKSVRSNRTYVDMETGMEVKALERTGSMHPHNIFLELLKGETYVCCGCYMLRSREFFDIYPEGKMPVYGVGQNFQMLLPYMYKYDCYSVDLPLYKVNRRSDSHSAGILTKEEEYKKYQDYENLIDDVVTIAGITDAKSLQEVQNWKYKRQQDLFTRHKDRPALRNCHRLAYKNGMISIGEYIKKVFGTTIIGRGIRKIKYVFQRLKINYQIEGRKRYLQKQRARLQVKQICLISSNCIGGAILHDLGIQFCSPFVNLLVKPKDYIKLLKNLPEYMASELIFIKEEGIDYPLARLKDIKIYFVHYNSETEAKAKWMERTARMDYDHLYVLFCDRGMAEDQDKDIMEFDKLPYAHKAVLVNRPRPDIKSAVYLKGYEKQREIGMLIAYKNKFSYKKKYDAFDYVSWFNESSEISDSHI